MKWSELGFHFTVKSIRNSLNFIDLYQNLDSADLGSVS